MRNGQINLVWFGIAQPLCDPQILIQSRQYIRCIHTPQIAQRSGNDCLGLVAWYTIVSLSKERKQGQIMARAKLFMEQLQRAIKNFSVKCWSAWVDHNNTAALGSLSSSDWLTFIAEGTPFHSEQGGREWGTMGPKGKWILMWIWLESLNSDTECFFIPTNAPSCSVL